MTTDQTKQTRETSPYFFISPYFVDTIKTPGFDFEKFQDKIDKLTGSLYDLLISEEAYQLIVTLSDKYELTGDQEEMLSRVIRDVVITDIFIEDMPMAIRDKLKVEDTAAQDMAQTILTQLFQPVLEELKQNHATKFRFRLNKPAQIPVARPQTPIYQAPQPPTTLRPPVAPPANAQRIPEKESIVNNIDSNIINLRKQ